jgi:hypothetical protein
MKSQPTNNRWNKISTPRNIALCLEDFVIFSSMVHVSQFSLDTSSTPVRFIEKFSAFPSVTKNSNPHHSNTLRFNCDNPGTLPEAVMLNTFGTSTRYPDIQQERNSKQINGLELIISFYTSDRRSDRYGVPGQVSPTIESLPYHSYTN